MNVKLNIKNESEPETQFTTMLQTLSPPVRFP